MQSMIEHFICVAAARCSSFMAVGLLAAAGSVHAGEVPAKRLELPTSKHLMLPVPGDPQRVNSLPMSLAASPNGRWVVSLNAGYGTFESGYMQSLAVLDTSTGTVRDFPEGRTLPDADQTFFSGLAFSGDGTKVYASLASSHEMRGDGTSGNGVVVYGFAEGILRAEKFLPLLPVSLASDRHSSLLSSDGRTVNSFPAAVAVVPGKPELLLVAENLSDSIALLNPVTGALVRRFDVSVSANVPAAYPIALAVTQDGTRAFAALWNLSEVVELDLVGGRILRHLALQKPSSASAAGSHPCSLVVDEQAGMLYVALSNRDAIAAVDIHRSNAESNGHQFRLRGYFNSRLPGQSYFGAQPSALALNADGSRLYAANLGVDAIAVIDTRSLHASPHNKSRGDIHRAIPTLDPIGFVPTELMPLALASVRGRLYVASAKGKGTGPNNMPQRPTEATRDLPMMKQSFTYAPSLLYGSLATLDETALEMRLKEMTDEVLESNLLKAAAEAIPFAGGVNPIKHVIYVIKENRTYDQVLGDLESGGKAVGNGDPSLTMYGAAVTPNEHRLALQFGVIDNFFDSGEVSGDGHVWSNAAIGTDYVEETWQQNYRGQQRTYDYEGVVADGYPLIQNIPDISEPTSGYLWGNFVAHGRTIYHFAEYVSSIFCDDKKKPKRIDPKLGAMSGGVAQCANRAVKPGETLPEEWGGGKNLWPWAIPRLARNIPTKPQLVGHFAAEFPDFNLRVPDQIRVDVVLRHLEKWKLERAAGHDTMPNFILVRLPNDHTAGTTMGGPTPKASVADNDLAVGRLVEAVSHSEFWNDTAICMLEDDAQEGADHVDAHRSLAIIASKYAPHPDPGQAAVVDSRFYSTVSMVRTMEALLQVPPMNNNDAFASLISTVFTGPGDQPAFVADTSNRDNGLIYQANGPNATGSALSGKMDFSHADRADPPVLNLILWADAMGAKPPPPMLRVKKAQGKEHD